MISPVNLFLERVTQQNLMEGTTPTDGLMFQVISVPGTLYRVKLIARCTVAYVDYVKPQEFQYSQVYDVRKAFPHDFFDRACTNIADRIITAIGLENVQKLIKQTKASTGVNVAQVFVKAMRHSVHTF